MLKKSFTLFEILISLFLVVLIYSLAISSFKLDNRKSNTNLNLNTLREYLLEYSFDKDISIKCTKDLKCFLLIDNEKQETQIENLFSSVPEVYELNKNYDYIDFGTYVDDEEKTYDLIFDFHCKDKFNCDEYIIKTEEQFFLIKNLEKTTLKFLNRSDIDEYFDELIREVEDAL